MNNKIAIFCCAGAAMFLSFGCAQSRLEMDYGTSYQLQKYNQTLNPDAEKNLEPVYGLSARAAEKAEEKYQKSFEKSAETSTTYQFNLGGSK